jgi:amino acid transporter
MALGGIIPLAVVAVFIAIFFHGYGSDFLRAAQANGLPAGISSPGTPFFYLSSIGVGNTVYALLVFVLYIVFWPLITYISSLQPTRAIFAMSFDGALPSGVTRVNSRGCPWLALLISLLLSAAVFIYAVDNQTGFFQILAYATLVQLIAMALVGLSGVLAPRLRPELFRASTSQKTIAGVPVVSIAGVGAILTAVFVWFAYLHYDQLGTNNDIPKLLFWTLGPAILGLLFFIGVRAVKGAEAAQVYREIPPE